jgi:predicted phosphodiesterase
VVGDTLDIASPVPMEAQIVAVRTTLTELGRRTRLLLCSGNHDLDSLNPAGEKTAAWVGGFATGESIVDGQTASAGDVLFTVLPWWDGPAARAEAEKQLEEAAARREGAWVWVYHSPPESRLSWTGQRHFGDAAVREWIERHGPDVVLCGHIHQAPFSDEGSWIDRIGDTWLFNPGKQIGEAPACIDLDLADRTAAWISLTGFDEQAFPIEVAQ